MPTVAATWGYAWWGLLCCSSTTAHKLDAQAVPNVCRLHRPLPPPTTTTTVLVPCSDYSNYEIDLYELEGLFPHLLRLSPYITDSAEAASFILPNVRSALVALVHTRFSSEGGQEAIRAAATCCLSVMYCLCFSDLPFLFHCVCNPHCETTRIDAFHLPSLSM